MFAFLFGRLRDKSTTKFQILFFVRTDSQNHHSCVSYYNLFDSLLAPLCPSGGAHEIWLRVLFFATKGTAKKLCVFVGKWMSLGLQTLYSTL